MVIIFCKFIEQMLCKFVEFLFLTISLLSMLVCGVDKDLNLKLDFIT